MSSTTAEATTGCLTVIAVIAGALSSMAGGLYALAWIAT